MHPTDREAMQQALEALENPWKAGPDGVANAITALRERLAQPEPPPECKTEEERTAFAFGYWKAVEAQRVRLTEEQVVALWRKHKEVMAFARELLTIEREAVLKLVRTYVSNKNLEEAIETRLFDDWGSFPYKGCPPCNQNCRQGRDCPARK